jgi:hypothetical protein
LAGDLVSDLHLGGLQFEQPAVPSVVPILELHRGSDGFVSFAQKGADGKWLPLWNVKASDLQRAFPQLADELLRDSYFSINAFYRGGGYRRGLSEKLGPIGNSVQTAFRRADGARYLTACFADLDCHALGITPGQAVGAVIDAQIAKTIPPVSMLLYSGRGVWCYWFVASGDGLVKAFPDETCLWVKIQHAIGGKLAALGADANARDVARVCRIAGSVNSKSSSHVAYYLGGGANGKRFVYSLSELAAAFGVARQAAGPGVVAKDQALQARGATGAAARWRYDRQRFELLWELRQTWPVGMRNKAMSVWVSILASLRDDDELSADELWNEAVRLWRDFDQPDDDRYTLGQVRKTIASIKARDGNRRNLRAQSISDTLGVTAEESAFLAEHVVVKYGSRGWPAAGAVIEQPAVPRPEAKRRRRELISQLWAAALAAGRKPPSLAKLVEQLADVAGIDVTAMTVRKDLAALSLENPRSVDARQRKQEKRKRSQRKLFPE